MVSIQNYAYILLGDYKETEDHSDNYTCVCGTTLKKSTDKKIEKHLNSKSHQTKLNTKLKQTYLKNDKYKDLVRRQRIPTVNHRWVKPKIPRPLPKFQCDKCDRRIHYTNLPCCGMLCGVCSNSYTRGISYECGVCGVRVFNNYRLKTELRRVADRLERGESIRELPDNPITFRDINSRMLDVVRDIFPNGLVIHR